MYTVFETGWGWMGAVYSDRGIKRIFLPFPQRAMILRYIKTAFPDALPGGSPSFIDGFQDYFEAREAREVNISADLDLTNASPFSIAVWKGAQAISLASTKSYQRLAEQIGRTGSQRAVGSALGRNPFPLIVPCHRVVRSDGALGGFSGSGGTALKRKLLEHEGVLFDGNGRVVLVKGKR